MNKHREFNWIFLNQKHAVLLLLKSAVYNVFVLKNFYKNYINSIYILLSIDRYLLTFINLRLSSLYYYPQSLDSFGYTQILNKRNVVVNVFFLTNIQTLAVLCAVTDRKDLIYSIETIFYNFWWFEREISELFGLLFQKKRDLRNLLLEYNNIYRPMLREFPSIGVYELYYNFVRQTHSHVKLSAQI